MNKYSGFTLIEILVVVGLIAILAAITIVALNPAKMFANSRNVERWNNLRAINDGLEQWVVDGNGVNTLTEGDGSLIADCGAGTTSIMDQPTVLDSEIDLDAHLVSTYIVSIPRDPTYSSGSYTGYELCKFNNPLRFLILAPGAELNQVISIPTLPAGPLGQGLVAYWPMDDNVSGSGQTITDHSVNGFDGITSGSPNCTVRGRFSGGCEFVGNSGTDMINIGDPSPDILTPTQDGFNDDFTVAAWINIDDFSLDEGAIVSKWGGPTSFLFRTTTGGGIQVYRSVGAKSIPDGTLSTDTWYHVVVTFDDEVNEAEFYVNGQHVQKDVDTDWSAQGFTDTGLDLTIGRRSDASDEVDGTIDEVRIYNRILTDTEIEDLSKYHP